MAAKRPINSAARAGFAVRRALTRWRRSMSTKLTAFAFDRGFDSAARKLHFEYRPLTAPRRRNAVCNVDAMKNILKSRQRAGACVFAALVVVAGCTRRLGLPASHGLDSQPPSSGETLFVALDPAAPAGSTRLLLSGGAATAGIFYCLTPDAAAVAACEAGLGGIFTADQKTTQDGRRIFQANVGFQPAAGLRLTAVSHDASGQKTGAVQVELKSK
jgi:hypothetical protein